MSDLHDLFTIAPAMTKVKLGDRELEVGGLSFAQVARLGARFPKIAELLSDKVGEPLAPTDLAKLGADAVGAIIAIGFRVEGDAKAEQFASELQIWQQLALLGGILRCSVEGEGDVGPFVEAAMAKAMSGFLQQKPSAKSSSDSSAPAPPPTPPGP